MTSPADVVFLIDVDNTLLDNDRVIADLRAHLLHAFGEAAASRYWTVFEELRSELGYADYLGALQRFRGDVERLHQAAGTQDDMQLLRMSSFLIDYPFTERVYPGAFDALAHLRTRGPTVILSDGDVVFQPRKVQRSGLWDAVEGRVLIYVHKEAMLDAVQRLHPAHHYVMVDDKLRLLDAMKQVMGDRLTTVWPKQGHYAMDAKANAAYRRADAAVERIGDLADLDIDSLLVQRTTQAR